MVEPCEAKHDKYLAKQGPHKLNQSPSILDFSADIMYFVYILQSLRNSEKYYVGITNDLDRRLNQHNHSPSCSYTIRYSPWKLKTYICFEDKEKAGSFEVYLKSHSGKTFMYKRLVTKLNKGNSLK